MIRAADRTSLGEYRIAKWLDRNRPGERAFIGGDASFLYNVFTDNPQLAGGHEQHAVNTFIPVVRFTIDTGTNAGGRDAEYSIFWLKAFGARIVSIPGPESNDAIKPVVHPGKFDGVLPLLWRDHGDSIYEVPGAPASLAHVIPSAAVVRRTPVHGLDIAPAEAYVAALENRASPAAAFRWKGLSEAEIRATVDRGHVVAVQITDDPGWEAWSGGRRQIIRGDGLGQMTIEPDCRECEISLRYTGGKERMLTRAMSLGALLAAIAFALV